MDKVTKQQFHFVPVRGACHGAWCWYKLMPLLKASGHRITTVDQAASGINMNKIDEVTSLADYTSPLLEIMEGVTTGEKVVLVGHSLGGLSLALAADMYSEKVSVAVFVTALVPDTVHNSLYVAEYFFGEKTSPDAWMDTKFEFDNQNARPKINSIRTKGMCDKAMSTIPTKKSSEKGNRFTNKGHGSADRVYIVCNEDQALTLEIQCWMIEKAGVKEVKEIDGADHMPMFSEPKELCDGLLDIAYNHP